MYSYEGNYLARNLVEPVRKRFLRNIARTHLLTLSKALTLFLYVPIYTIYLLPVEALPYYEYFQNFRELSYQRNLLNVFDKLNAPQVEFITRDRVEKWFSEKHFKDIHLSSYRGVSWRASGTLRG